MTFDRVFAGGRIAEDYATGAVWYDEGGYMMALFHLPRDRYEAIRDRVLRIDWQRGSDSDALWSHDPENNPTPPAYEDLVREAADLDHTYALSLDPEFIQDCEIPETKDGVPILGKAELRFTLGDRQRFFEEDGYEGDEEEVWDLHFAPRKRHVDFHGHKIPYYPGVTFTVIRIQPSPTGVTYSFREVAECLPFHDEEVEACLAEADPEDGTLTGLVFVYHPAWMPGERAHPDRGCWTAAPWLADRSRHNFEEGDTGRAFWLFPQNLR